MLPDINIRNIKNILCVFMGFFIFFLSYAYASFTSELSISGEAIVRAETDIRVVNVYPSIGENSGFEEYNSKYSVNTTSHYIVLPYCDSDISYIVTVQNNSDVSYFVKNVKVLSTTNENVTFSISPSINDTFIEPNSSVDYTVTFKYNSCTINDDENDNSKAITLEYEFVKAKGYLYTYKNTPLTTDTYFMTTSIVNKQIKTISFLGNRDVPDDAIGSFDVTEPSKVNDGDTVMLWYYKASDYTDENPLYDVYIGTSNEVVIDNASYLFTCLSNLTTINFKDSDNKYRFSTKETTKMNGMFSLTPSLTSIDLSGFDTSNVTKMDGMFRESGITELDLSSFDTNKVDTMGSMFYGTLFTKLDLSYLETNNVTDMSNMFNNSSIEELDLSTFNTDKVTNMAGMFGYAKATSIILPDNFNTSNVTNMSSMFDNVKATNIDFSSFDTSKVTNMYRMFRGIGITDLDLSNWNTKNVTNMSSMFVSSSIVNLNLSGSFDTSSVTNMSSMFNNMKKLNNLVFGDGFVTSNVTNMSEMFSNLPNLNIDFSIFDTGKVENMYYMFSASLFTKLDLSNFNTSNVTNMQAMFFSMSNLTSLDLSNFNTSNVTNMQAMFSACTSLSKLSQNFDTKKVKSMALMFNMTAFTDLDLSNFDTSSVKIMTGMFRDCNLLETLDIRNFVFAENVSFNYFVEVTVPTMEIIVKSETEKNFLINKGISSDNITITS